ADGEVEAQRIFVLSAVQAQLYLFLADHPVARIGDDKEELHGLSAAVALRLIAKKRADLAVCRPAESVEALLLALRGIKAVELKHAGEWIGLFLRQGRP